MEKLKRRQLIKGGAAGTLALGALAVGASAASADEGRGGGIAIHIHGVLSGPFTLAVSLDVAGRRGDLAGSGWDSGTLTTGPTGMKPGGPFPGGPAGACYYTASGSIDGDVVTLVGRSLFTNRPFSLADSEEPTKSDTRADGRDFNGTANVKTGAITWELSPAGAAFAGTGTVVVFPGGRAAKDDD